MISAYSRIFKYFSKSVDIPTKYNTKRLRNQKRIGDAIKSRTARREYEKVLRSTEKRQLAGEVSTYLKRMLLFPKAVNHILRSLQGDTSKNPRGGSLPNRTYPGKYPSKHCFDKLYLIIWW